MQNLPLSSIDNNMTVVESIQNLYDDVKINQLSTIQENTVLKLQLEELMKRLAMPGRLLPIPTIFFVKNGNVLFNLSYFEDKKFLGR